MIFQPEYAEDISSVYFLNQIFESGFDLFAKKCQKGYDPYQYCLCVISSCSIDKQIAHCCFLLIKLKKEKQNKKQKKAKKQKQQNKKNNNNKKKRKETCIMHSSFWMYYLKHA